MAITYTDNFSLPLLESGSDGWDAVMNGMLETVDLELKAAQTPIVLLSSQAIVVSLRLGEVILKHYDNQ